MQNGGQIDSDPDYGARGHEMRRNYAFNGVSEQKLHEKLTDVHQNPVKAGLDLVPWIGPGVPPGDLRSGSPSGCRSAGWTWRSELRELPGGGTHKAHPRVALRMLPALFESHFR